MLWSKAVPIDRALHEAINAHNVANVRTLLSAGANSNAKDRDGHTLLMIASRDDANVAIVQLLIDSGANVNAERGSVLLYALGGNDNPKNITVLLKAGATVDARNGDSTTALMTAALYGHADIIRLLLAAGANVNAMALDGNSAIDFAANSEIRNLLISAGANPYGRLASIVARLGQETPPKNLKQLVHDVSNAIYNIERIATENEQSENDRMLDSLQLANAYLQLYLERYLPKIPQTLTNHITHEVGVNVTTSSDQKLRFWSWDTRMGGSMPEIQELAEFAMHNGIQVVDPTVRDDGNQDSWVREIRAKRMKAGKTIYLAISGWQGDGKHRGEQVNAYAIQDSSLTPVPLFKTKKGLLNSISYYSAGGHDNNFKFLDNGNMFLVPLAKYASAEDRAADDVTMTSHSLRYEFDGRYYVYRGIQR